MYYWVKTKLTHSKFLFTLIIVLASFLLVEKTQYKVENPFFPEQIEAARIMQVSLDTIKQERISETPPAGAGGVSLPLVPADHSLL